MPAQWFYFSGVINFFGCFVNSGRTLKTKIRNKTKTLRVNVLQKQIKI